MHLPLLRMWSLRLPLLRPQGRLRAHEPTRTQWEE